MPVMANIVLADAATTPVNHTFLPSQKDGDVAVWENQQTVRGKPERLTVKVGRFEESKKQASRLTLWQPHAALVPGDACCNDKIVVRGVSFGLDISVDPNATEQDVKDALKMFSQLLQNTDVVAAVSKGEQFRA